MRYFIPLLFISLPLSLCSQENEVPKLQLRGYLKSLQATSFLPQEFAPFPLPSNKVMFNDMLLHNRLNFKWLPTDFLNVYAEVRSRIFWGDQVRYTLLSGGDYVENVSRGSDGFFDWSLGAQNNNGYAVHTTLDRFYAEYYKGDWELRLGRQRVNWGIATTWNPNDIFNAYNFTDFDYEERPGSDALRIKRYTGVASSFELAVSAFDDWEEATAAILAKFNTGSYDWQVLAGVAQNNTVLGGGWAGNLGNASFKGEAAWFHPLGDSLDNSFALTLGIDYTLENQLYLNGGFLFNSEGSTGGNVAEIFAFELSARNLYPYRYSVLAQVGYPVTPLLNAAMVLVYSPGEAHAAFVNPVITYSLAQNWDLDLLAQILLENDGGKYKSPVQAGFLRVKWSF